MHEKTHNGEKPYICPVCGALFSKKFHMIRHHANQHARRRRGAEGGVQEVQGTGQGMPTGLEAAGGDKEKLRTTVEVGDETILH
jgi:uncharacterized C2H2 Zn-finger protein